VYPGWSQIVAACEFAAAIANSAAADARDRRAGMRCSAPERFFVISSPPVQGAEMYAAHPMRVNPKF
jgi:sarcosine oxidase gamma subunit